MRAVEAAAVGDLGERVDLGLLLRLGELRLQGVDALRHLREQDVVAALLLDHGVLQLLRLGGDQALQLADVVDVGERADAIGRAHQVDVEGLGLAGEVGERLAQDLDDRGQLLLALAEDRARVLEVGVAELQDAVDRVGQLVRAHAGDQRLAQPVDAGLEVGGARRVRIGAPGRRGHRRWWRRCGSATATATGRRGCGSGRARWDVWSWRRRRPDRGVPRASNRRPAARA